MSRRALLSLVLVGTAACADAPPTTPTSPAQTTFVLTGTVTVSAPSNTPLGGVTMTVVDGPWAGYSTTTNQDGEFTFSGLSGSISLRASIVGYQSQTIAVDMTEARNIRLTLKPEPKVLQQTLTRPISAPGQCDVPCRLYTLDIHNDGDVEATLTWSSFGAGLKLSLWRGDTLLMSSTHVGTLRQAFMAPVPVTGGFAYQLRVSVTSGAEPADFTVGLRRPN